MSERVLNELAALTRLAAGSPRFDRVLSGADIPSAAKRALLSDVTKNGFDPQTIDAAVAAIDSSDSTATAGLLSATLEAAFTSFDVEPIETSLYEIGKLIETNSELRQSLSNFAVDDQAKSQLLRELLAGKSNEVAIELASTFVYVSHGRSIGNQVIDAARQAAERRNTVIADVRTAVEIDEERQRSLSDALQASLGRNVRAQFSVDPSIIGSVVVRVGDEVFDGSVRHRLEQARLAVASS